MNKTLIVIDMLNDFVDKDGALYVQGAEKLIPNSNKLIEHFDKVIFVCDCHEENDKEFEVWPLHCVLGTKGAKIHPEINNKRTSVKIFKDDLSMFSNNSINNHISPEENELYIVGVATDYCIVNAIMNSTSKYGEKIRGAVDRGFTVNLVVDAIAGVDEIPGVVKTKGKISESLIKMGRAGINAVYTEDVIKGMK